MLKHRILTALVLVPFVIWSILFASKTGFTYGLAVVLFLASLEWNNFIAFKNKINAWLFSATITFSFLMLEFLAKTEYIELIIYLSLIWWLISLPLLFSFPFKPSHFMQQKPAKVVIGYVMLLATFLALNLLRNSDVYGVGFVIYLLLIIWIADSGAYFAGRAFGKRKLLPNVSPGKSWEGVYGALLATLIAAFTALEVLAIPSSQAFFFIALTLVTIVYSVIGDLSESMFKRMAGMKDSGKLLPGHGGILDRIDSLTSALPIFITGLWLMEKVS